MEKSNKIDLTSDGISTGKFKLDDGQLEAFNDNQPNYIGDFIPDPYINTPFIPGDDLVVGDVNSDKLTWSNDVVLPISVKQSDDGQRELTLYSDGSLSIKHINTNSLMIYADTKIYEKMLIENNITNHKEDEEDEELGEARELKLGEKEV